jgi:hypothetical protein
MSGPAPCNAAASSSTGEALLFTDKNAFLDFVRFLDVNGSVPADTLLADIADGKAINIDKDTPVRIVERLHGGAKVIITLGPLAGKVGRVQAGAVPEEPTGQVTRGT